MAIEAEEVKAKSQVTGRQVALVVGGVLLLLVLFWFLFLRGGGGEQEVAVPPPTPDLTTPAPTDEPGGGANKDDGDKPPVKTFEVFASRDPFKPLLVASDAGGAGDGSTTDDGGTTTDDGGTSTDPDEPGTDTDGDGDIDGDDAPGGDDGSNGENVEGHTVQLISVNDQGSVSIQIDDTVYEVSEGESFAENFKLLSTSGECATVLFGDDQFTVCEGEEILK